MEAADRVPAEISKELDRLPSNLLERSGSVFYSSKQAFYGKRPLYLLGLNPGGDPHVQRHNTIAKHIREFKLRDGPWSAYADDSWEGALPGNWGMQPRILHLLRRLKMDPHQVPASNVIFARSRSEAELRDHKAELLDACWPVHNAVIETLGVRAVVCFGGTAGRWVRERLAADEWFDSFKESNARGWTSEAHRTVDGRMVVTVTHPGRADWRNPLADPTDLVRRAIGT